MSDATRRLMFEPAGSWRAELTARWPNIGRFLWVEPSGWVENDFHRWQRTEKRLSAAGQAAGNEEWADFYEWRLGQRADELAGDPGLRGLVEEWTADMAYCCRRCAAFARGEDPGEPLPLSVRRPDLYAAKHARIEAIIARLNLHGDLDHGDDAERALRVVLATMVESDDKSAELVTS